MARELLTYGASIVMADRHFLNAVVTHIADIDYETIIMYTGGYDDMVMQKSQVRSRLEQQNAAKGESSSSKISCNASVPVRANQVQSRKKEISKLKLMI